MNGFFAPEALEALQQAYEMQLTPEEQDYDLTTGLPTNQVSNTSPWHGTVDLWKYPDGKNKLETSPIMYHGSDEEEYDDEEGEEEYDDDTVSQYEADDEEALSDEEIDNLIEELLFSDEVED
jgi:hypothetical protein